jgi:hypothetical protein
MVSSLGVTAHQDGALQHNIFGPTILGKATRNNRAKQCHRSAIRDLVQAGIVGLFADLRKWPKCRSALTMWLTSQPVKKRFTRKIR